MTFAEEVKKELLEMKRIGIYIPENALKLCTPEELNEYDNMSVSDCANLIIDLFC